MPDEAEARGLLALMLLHAARAGARINANGSRIALEHQDRDLWDHAQIAQADALLRAAMEMGRIGPYQLQAAIAALHALAPDWDSTDWSQIAALYGVLEQVQPSAVVTLNRAVAWSFAAWSFAGRLQDGLAMLDAIATDLQGYGPFHAARADMLARDGQRAAANECFQVAINLAGNAVDRAFLQDRQARLRLS